MYGILSFYFYFESENIKILRKSRNIQSVGADLGFFSCFFAQNYTNSLKNDAFFLEKNKQIWYNVNKQNNVPFGV